MSKKNATFSSYERTYTIVDMKPEVYLDLIELDDKHYQVKRMSLKNLSENELIKVKVTMNSRLFIDEWTNGELEIKIDKSLIDADSKIRILFENDANYKVSNELGKQNLEKLASTDLPANATTKHAKSGPHQEFNVKVN